MRSTHPVRLGGATLVVASLLAWSVPGAAAAAPTSCSAPELAQIDADLLKARVAIAAGDDDTLQAALTAARDGLDEIVTTCWGAPASPGPEGSAAPTIGPVDLGATTTLGDRTLAYPSDLAPVESELLRSIDEDGHAATAITLADSDASGELLRGQLEARVPDGFRVISIAAGDPTGALGSIGAFETFEVVSEGPLAALEALGRRIEEVSAQSDVPIVVKEVHPLTFPDGGQGGTLDIDFTSPEGELLAQGRFAIRPLSGGDWAVGVAVASESGFGRIGDELDATLAAITGS